MKATHTAIFIFVVILALLTLAMVARTIQLNETILKALARGLGQSD